MEHGPNLTHEQRSFLAQVNTREGVAYELLQAFPGSVNSGAFVVGGPQGRRILKWVRTTPSFRAQFNAKAVTDALAPMGYPVPRYERIEELGEGGYVVMTELAGDRATFQERGAEEAQAVIALNRLQQVRSPLSGGWPRDIIASVLNGGDGYCFPDAMNVSDDAALICRVLQRLALDHAEAPTVRDAIVHKDMNPGNILLLGGTISGIVDWENTCAGDPLYDLVYLWFCCYGYERCRLALWSHITTTGIPQTIALCASHVILGFLSGMFHHRRPERHHLPRLAHGFSALADLRALGISTPGIT